MREILFRGKRVEDGEWIEGYYVRLYGSNGRVSRRIYTSYAEVDCGDYYPDFFDVQPSTVGQYTGLKDKNGKKIFEGDVVRLPYEYFTIEKKKGYYGFDNEGYPQKIPGYEGFGEYQVLKRGFKNFPVKFRTTAGFYAEGTLFSLNGINVEVVGNIYDNPELLEGGVEENAVD